MLVLSRKRGDAVVVGGADNCKNAVKVIVLEIGTSYIKLGFEGPRDTPIHRGEVWERINGQNGDLSSEIVPPKKSVDHWDDDRGSSDLTNARPLMPLAKPSGSGVLRGE